MDVKITTGKELPLFALLEKNMQTQENEILGVFDNLKTVKEIVDILDDVSKLKNKYIKNFRIRKIPRYVIFPLTKFLKNKNKLSADFLNEIKNEIRTNMEIVQYNSMKREKIEICNKYLKYLISEHCAD